MSDVNRAPSQVYPGAYAQNITPQSVAAAATVTGGWVEVAQNKWAAITSIVGAGAGTLAVKVEQATSSGGAGAKDLITAANLGINGQAATTEVQADLNLDSVMDVDGGFTHIRLSGTVTGGSGTLVAVVLELGPAAIQA